MNVSDAPLTAGRPLLVLSPHLDDAWLSTSALLTSPVDAEVWTVYAGRPTPPLRTEWDHRCGFPDSDATMAARIAEDEAAFVDSGVAVRHLPLLEAAYRDGATARRQLTILERELRGWIADHSDGVVALPVGAGVQVRPAPWERLRRRPQEDAAPETGEPAAPSTTAAPDHAPRWKQVVRAAMHADHQRRRREAQRRGMAANPDHLLVRDLGLRVCAETATLDVVLWEDLPYLWHERGTVSAGLLQRRGIPLQQFDLPVDTSVKQRRLAHYRSQLELLDPRLNRLTDADRLPTTETYWQLQRTESR